MVICDSGGSADCGGDRCVRAAGVVFMCRVCIRRLERSQRWPRGPASMRKGLGRTPVLAVQGSWPGGVWGD